MWFLARRLGRQPQTHTAHRLNRGAHGQLATAVGVILAIHSTEFMQSLRVQIMIDSRNRMTASLLMRCSTELNPTLWRFTA